MTESLAILQLQKGDPNKALGLAEILLEFVGGGGGGGGGRGGGEFCCLFFFG